jgi:hypothetical protein
MFSFLYGLEPLSSSSQIAATTHTDTQLKCAPSSLSINIQHDCKSMHFLAALRNELLIARIQLATQVL